MRGHVRKRGSKWSIVLDIGKDENGKRKQKWYSGFRTKKEAEAKLTELLHNINKGEYVDSKNLTIKDYLYRWLSDYAKQNVSPKSYRSYKDTIENHLIPHLGTYKLDKINPSIIQKFYTYCIEKTNLSNTSVLYNHKILSQALKHAVKWQLLSRNPCDATQPPRKNKYEANVLKDEEVKILLETCCSTPIYTPVFIALTTGMRQGEIAGLRWEDINLKEKTIYVRNTLQRINGEYKLMPTKTTKSKRTIAMFDSLISHLKEIRKEQMENKLRIGNKYNDSNFVCTWEDGQPLGAQYISKKFSKIIKRTKITRVRFHDLRHTHATLLLKEGIHPKIVSERLGHSKIGITLDLYSHVTPNMQKEAVKKLEKSMFE